MRDLYFMKISLQLFPHFSGIYSEGLDGMVLILTLLENELPSRSFVKIWPRFDKDLFFSLKDDFKLSMNLEDIAITRNV